MSTNTKRNSRKKSTNPLDNHIEQYVSELRTSGRSLGPEAFSEAVRTFSQRFVEAMLQGEMDAHLTGCQPTEAPPEEVDADELLQVPNKRNGFSHKTLKTEYGPLPLSVLRDRKNTFDPIIVPKHSRSFGKMDEQIIAMYARGMSTRDIQASSTISTVWTSAPTTSARLPTGCLKTSRSGRIARSQVCIRSLSLTPSESKSAVAHL